MRGKNDKSGTFSSEILDASASAYAGFAASLLLERHPEIGERYAPSALAHWKTHLAERLRELSTAVAYGNAELFAARVRWARQAFLARDAPEEDLRASLEVLREVLGEELPDSAGRDTRAALDLALEIFEGPVGEAEIRLDSENPLDRIALEYVLTALEGGSRRAIDRVVAAVDDGLGIRDAYLRILLPAQLEIGRLWHTGEVSIAEEHQVTATTRRAMAVLLHRAPTPAPNGRTVVAAAVANNIHDVAVRAIADFFELAGWRVVCLGADVPIGEVAHAVRAFSADLLALSATLTVQLKLLEGAVAAVRASPETSVKILVGGLAFDDAPELWRELGADGYAATVDGALAVGERLVGASTD